MSGRVNNARKKWQEAHDKWWALAGKLHGAGWTKGYGSVSHRLTANSRVRLEAQVNNAKRNENQAKRNLETEINKLERAKQIVEKHLKKTIIYGKVLYGPYGTRTLNAMKRFPSFRLPTHREYNEALRSLPSARRTRFLGKKTHPKKPTFPRYAAIMRQINRASPRGS